MKWIHCKGLWKSMSTGTGLWNTNRSTSRSHLTGLSYKDIPIGRVQQYIRIAAAIVIIVVVVVIQL
jgi:hypothetical protein